MSPVSEGTGDMSTGTQSIRVSSEAYGEGMHAEPCTVLMSYMQWAAVQKFL